MRTAVPEIRPALEMTWAEAQGEYATMLDIHAYQTVRILPADARERALFRGRKSPPAFIVVWYHDPEGKERPMAFHSSEREILHMGKQIVSQLGSDRDREHLDSLD